MFIEIITLQVDNKFHSNNCICRAIDGITSSKEYNISHQFFSMVCDNFYAIIGLNKLISVF